MSDGRAACQREQQQLLCMLFAHAGNRGHGCVYNNAAATLWLH